MTDWVCSQPAYCTDVYESDDTRGCSDTICPPEEERGAARNTLRIVMQHIYCWRIKELCIELVIWKSLYYDARSKKHQIYKTFPEKCTLRTKLYAMVKRNPSLLMHLKLTLKYIDGVFFLKPWNIPFCNITHNNPGGIPNNRPWPICISLSADA